MTKMKSFRSIPWPAAFAVSGVALAVSTGALARKHGSGATGSVSGDVTAAREKFRAGVVVSLDATPPRAVHPPKAPAVMNQKGLRFEPRVLAVLRGTTVRFNNEDDVNHNVFSPEGDKFDLGAFGKGQIKEHVFNETGAFVQLCKLHPEMMAYIVVVDSPYFAVTDAAGHFEIDGVPPGSYKLTVWSERLKAPTQDVVVTSGASTPVTIELKR